MKSDTNLLEDMCELIADCPHSTPKWTDSGILVIRNQNIKNGRLDLSKPSYTDEENYQYRIKRAEPKENDIVFTREAPMGELCLIPKNLKVCLGQRQVLLRPKLGVNAKYLYYALQSSYVRHQISWNEGTGTTVSNIRIPFLKQFLIPRNKNSEDEIANILSTLDDKIELNRKMNQTLEEMAQVLFTSWFVDFDPVHAKAGCESDEELEVVAKELGISKEVLELFPSEFVESEMGMIPLGWEVKPLDQIAHYQNGLALQKFRPKDENNFLPVLKIAQLKKGYADGEEKADPNIKPECIVDDGDVVFSWSGSLVVDVWCGGKVALNQHLFKVTSNEYAKWFYYHWTKQHLLNFQRVAAAKAVTMGHIKRSHLAEALCVVPDDTVFNMTETMLNPLLEKLILNRLEINNLQKTRDILLPKLLSGELDVSKITTNKEN